MKKESGDAKAPVDLDLDPATVVLLLRNVDDRLDKDYRLRASLSSFEIRALRTAITELDAAQSIESAPPGQTVPEPAPVRLRPKRPAPPVAPPLDRSSLELTEPQNTEVTVCIDFGTAMSKACAVDESTGAVLDLPLGRAAGEPSAVYPVTSSVWFGSDGRIFFGPQAVEQSLMHEGGRTRFDSLKQQVSLGLDARDLAKAEVPEGINPTEIHFSVRDLITLYLAYLTDLVGTELSMRHQRPRYVRRRLAIPVWRREHWVALDEQLHEMLATAQLVADTFEGSFRAGIFVEHARAILDEVAELPRLPGALAGRPVLEPIAAGVSCVSPDTDLRGLVMVVDCGAGTTDLALFIVRVDPEREVYRAWHVDGCAAAVNLAGDTLDEALRALILRKSGVTSAHAQFRLINDGLSRELRSLKEALFRDGKVTVTLVNDSTLVARLDELMAEPMVRDFQRTVRERFVDVLGRAHPSFFDGLPGRPVTVCLTGGGADLELLRDLGRGTVEVGGRTVPLALAPREPDYLKRVDDPAVRAAFPQLAVALGGASSSLPTQGKVVDRFMGGA